VVYLPPFVAWPDVNGFAEEGWKTRDFMDNKYKSQQDMQIKINRALYIAYAKDYIIIFLGTLSGILMLEKKRTGRYLALLLASIMIGTRIVAALMHSKGVVGWFKIIYGYLYYHSTLMVIHKDIISPIFFIVTIIILCNKSVSVYFVSRRLTTG
jgi:hypothetical protein